MSSSFHALDVGPGEAFLLRTDHGGKTWNILFDAGYTKEKVGARSVVASLAKNINEIGKFDLIDVAICSHKDGDHSGGFSHLIESWCGAGKKIGEVWLPGKWAAAFPEVVTKPLKFLSTIRDGSISLAEHIVSDLEEYSDRVSADIYEKFDKSRILEKYIEVMLRGEAERGLASKAFGISAEEAESISSRDDEDDVVDDIYKIVEEKLYGDYDFLLWEKLLGRKITAIVATKILRSVIDTAEEIRKIATLCLKNDIKVRWFDFGLYEKTKNPSFGYKGFLNPVNAVEVTSPPRGVAPVDVVYCLYLSEYNVESLVVHRVETEREPGVLFLADSRLAFGEKAPSGDFDPPEALGKRRYLVTAPHHGSSTNDHAYTVLDGWKLDDVVFVRNGGHHKTKLNQFKKIENRTCAYCNQCKRKARLLTVKTDRTGNWNWKLGTSVPLCHMETKTAEKPKREKKKD
ncbi:hypothetical protein AZL_002280 [Azospirillum sp. B510]|uniref:hypothetical protein n=1 Tax=Azospirillum sp. (strain B510) TaxID=137722 RepID=UPI0001C4C233|nr:hypothetical protein [Azospirillum sp. B510]BAI70866.1 hypothetical protein AZL_002280 [Azospirillum sp. B510]